MKKTFKILIIGLPLGIIAFLSALLLDSLAPPYLAYKDLVYIIPLSVLVGFVMAVNIECYFRSWYSKRCGICENPVTRFEKRFKKKTTFGEHWYHPHCVAAQLRDPEVQQLIKEMREKGLVN